MAFFPKQAGTTEDTFKIGAGYGKIPFTFDVTSLASPITWVLPATNGSAGYVLTNDSTGILSWSAAGSASDQTTPYFIPVSEIFTNNLNKQNLFATTIDIEGTLVVDGILEEVS